MLLLTAEVEFVGVVIHATSIFIHFLGTLLVKFFQQAEDAACDLAALLEALLGVRVLLLAVEEGNVLRAAPDRDVLRRRHQHRRSRDRLPRGVYGGAARRHRCGRGGFTGLLVLEIWRRTEGERKGRSETATPRRGRRRRDDGGDR